MLAKKTKWLWIGFLALGPLACLVGLWLTLRYDPHVRVSLHVDRATAIDVAARYAVARGMQVAGWDSFARFKYDNDLMFFYRMRPREHAQSLAPEAGIGVLFRAPDRSETVEVELSHQGHPVGFIRKFARRQEVGDPGEAAARQIAEAALRARLDSLGMTAATTDLELSNSSDAGAFRQYKWRWPFGALPELKVESVLAVRGSMLVEDRIEADLDSNAVWPRSQVARIFKGVSLLLYSLLLFVTVVYGLYRFVQRARQQEVSYARAFLLGGIFAAVMAAFVLILDTALYATNRNPGFPAPDWMILFSGSMVYVVLGLFSSGRSAPAWVKNCRSWPTPGSGALPRSRLFWPGRWM